MKRVFGLDILRALAIVCVLWCHFLDVLYHYTSGWLEIIFNYVVFMLGFYGVEIFFILSGFLIGNIFYKSIVQPGSQSVGMHSIGNFLMKRWVRTLPNYFLFILVNACVYYYLNGHFFDLHAIARYFVFLQSYDYKSTIDFFGVSWSLTVEEWFYFILAIAFLTAFAVLKHHRKAFFFALFVLFAVPLFLKLRYCLTAPLVQNHAQVFVYTTFFRLDSIGFGVLLAWILNVERFKEILLRKSRLLLYVGLSLIFFSLLYSFFFLAKTEQYSFLYLLFSPLCDIGIVLCFPFFLQIREFGNHQINRVVMLISLSSYSLYLCHVPIMRLFANVDKKYFHLNQSLTGAIVEFLLLILLAVAVANLNYRYFELPILKFRDRLEKRFAKKIIS